MSARLALAALALFAVLDSFVLVGSDAFAQTVINRNPRAPATFDGNNYYNPGGNNSVTVTDQSSTNNGVTTNAQTTASTTPNPAPFTPNSYSISGFTPTPQGYKNAGQQSAITKHSSGGNGNEGYAPNAQFAPAATSASTNANGTQSAAEYNGAATAGANAANGAVGAANVNANAVNTTHSSASYNGD